MGLSFLQNYLAITFIQLGIENPYLVVLGIYITFGISSWAGIYLTDRLGRRPRECGQSRGKGRSRGRVGNAGLAICQLLMRILPSILLIVMLGCGTVMFFCMLTSGIICVIYEKP